MRENWISIIMGIFILLFPIVISFILFNKNKISDYTLIGLCIISRSMLWILIYQFKNNAT